MFQTYLVGFITRRGTLAGLAFSYQLDRNGNEPVTFDFLPIDGNIPLIRNFINQGIQIIDIDSTGPSSN